MKKNIFLALLFAVVCGTGVHGMERIDVEQLWPDLKGEISSFLPLCDVANMRFVSKEWRDGFENGNVLAVKLYCEDYELLCKDFLKRTKYPIHVILSSFIFRGGASVNDDIICKMVVCVRNLYGLTIGDCFSSEDSVLGTCLEFLPKSLKELNFYRCRYLSEKNLKLYISRFKSLKKLAITGVANVHGIFMFNITSQAIEELDFSSCSDLEDAGLEYTFKNNFFPKLKKLTVNNIGTSKYPCKFKGSWLRHLPSNREVTLCGLYFTNVTKSSIRAFVANCPWGKKYDHD